jgi:hypothetical protein|tara:strand:+ start:1436 stop:2089 length:654 start_codon:yes stop_codon:yes gene_type:complete
MAVIRNISKLVVPAYNKGPKDVIDYINAQAWIPTSADVGLIEHPGSFGSYVGSNGVITQAILQVTINATALVIPATTPVLGVPSMFPLSFWPLNGYVRVDDEIIKYTGVNPMSTSVSGFDEFVVASTADRGVLGSTAVTHTAVVGVGPVFVEVLLGATTKIEYNKEQGVFNVWTRTTQDFGTAQSYGAGDRVITYNTYLIPCPEDVVTFFETAPGVN